MSEAKVQRGSTEYRDKLEIYIARLEDNNRTMVKALKGVLHHDAGVKVQFQYPPLLIAQVRRALEKAGAL